MCIRDRRYMARKNQKITERLKPQMEKLQKQYTDRTILAQKQMQLNKQAGFSYFSSCLPAIVTMAVMFSLLGALNEVSQYMNFKEYYELYNRYDAAIVEYNGICLLYTSSMFFDDVLIQASTIINQKSLNKLQPFNTNDSNEYAQEFLSGFTANQYTKDGVACWEEAKTLIRQKLRAAILSQYTYDIVSSFNVSTECNNITYKYILLPVYVGHCNWRQKLYNFFVNGFNGKVTGLSLIHICFKFNRQNRPSGSYENLKPLKRF